MRHAIISCLTVMLCLRPIDTPAFSKDDAGAVDLAAMAEDIQIMQRVIARTLQDHLEEEGTAATSADPGVLLAKMADEEDAERASALSLYAAAGSTAQLWTRSLDLDVMGYYVPGTGVVFTLKLPVPVKEVDVAEEDSKPDLWKQIESQVRGTGSPTIRLGRPPKPVKHVTLDAGALDRAVDALVKTVGEYGARIEQLGGDESIILTARVRMQPSRPSAEKLLATTYTVLYQWIPQATADRVIIKVPVADARAFREGQVDLTAFKERCRIVKYRADTSGSNVLLRRP
jgi:hypothetical protein